jgi:hypothetical protein
MATVLGASLVKHAMRLAAVYLKFLALPTHEASFDEMSHTMCTLYLNTYKATEAIAKESSEKKTRKN